MTDNEVEDILLGDGWPVERLDATTLRSGFRSDGQPAFRFFIKLIPSWVCLTIVPFVVVPEPDDPKFLRRLLELNRELTLAKLALDRRDVIMTVELSRAELTKSQLADGLDALVYYANQHHGDLVALAGAGAQS